MENTNYSYIKKESVINSLKKMQRFEKDLDGMFKSYGLCLRENTGRRNILVSQAQEDFFAKELLKDVYEVTCSGKTGEADIIIHSLGKELECKLTSSKNRSWPLQCDYSTLKRKGSTDFLYVLSDSNFEKYFSRKKSVRFYPNINKKHPNVKASYFLLPYAYNHYENISSRTFDNIIKSLTDEIKKPTYKSKDYHNQFQNFQV